MAALAAGSSLGYAVAQESGDVDRRRREGGAVGAQTDEAALSPAAQRQAAESAVASASSSCDAQSKAHQSAKRDKDIIRATCLDDKVSQCEANLQNLKRRQAALDEAIAAGDSGRANHESTVIGVLSQKFKMLAQAANQCVGQDLFDTGETQTRSEVDLFAPDEDPTVIQPDPGLANPVHSSTDQWRQLANGMGVVCAGEAWDYARRTGS